MSDHQDESNKRDLSRRKLLQRLAMGGAAASVNLLPAKWIDPVVGTIVVPAYAGNFSGPSPSPPASTMSVTLTPTTTPF